MHFKVSVWIQYSQRQRIDSLKKENKSQNLCSNTTRGSVTLGLSLFWVILQNTGSSISHGTLGMCLRFHTFSWYLLFPSSLVKVFLPLREKKKKKQHLCIALSVCNEVDEAQRWEERASAVKWQVKLVQANIYSWNSYWVICSFVTQLAIHPLQHVFTVAVRLFSYHSSKQGLQFGIVCTCDNTRK